MGSIKRAMRIDAADNVAVMLQDVAAGEEIAIDGEDGTIIAPMDVNMPHKIFQEIIMGMILLLPFLVNIRTGVLRLGHLRKIRVKRFSEYSAKFFLKYAIFLTEKPAQFYPIWPVYIQDPYFIYHNASEFYFYLCGEDAELKSYPSGAKTVRTHDGIIYQISTREREQLVSFGKSGALGFSYLIRQSLKRTVPVPKVIIYDSTGNELTDDIYSKLPKEKLISVLCPYDGRAVIEKDGKTTYIYPLAAEQNVTIDGVSFGTTIRLFQGCDCVRTLSFTRKSAETDLSALDIEWVRKLNACKGPMIPVTHSTGAITTQLAGYPEVQKWLYKKIKLGEMPRSAYLLLQSILKKGELI